MRCTVRQLYFRSVKRKEKKGFFTQPWMGGIEITSEPNLGGQVDIRPRKVLKKEWYFIERKGLKKILSMLLGESTSLSVFLENKSARRK